MFNIIKIVLAVGVGILWCYMYQTPSSLISSISPVYDFIIVGAGTAGCVLGARLSQGGARVLLLEAGQHFGLTAAIPVAPTLLQRGPNDWAFRTLPQKYSSFGLFNKSQFLPRGKGLGGSGQMNYLLHGVGIPNDFDHWHKLGAHGWNYSQLETFLTSPFVCDNNDASERKCPVGSTNNNQKPVIRLSLIDKKLTEINNAFIKSAEEINGPLKFSVETFLNTIFRGQRESTYQAYLRPALERKNLHVLHDAIAVKVSFKQRHAKSVKLLVGNTIQHVSATKEIILCAGAIQTPQLLMLSGIGPKDELKRAHVSETVVSEGVGKNLHDHLNMPLYISIRKPISITLDKIKTLHAVFDYFWNKKGYLSSPGVVAMGRGPQGSALILFAVGSADEDLLREIANYTPETFRLLFPFYRDTGKEGFIFLATCLQPTSRGSVTLQNDNPLNPPLIDPNYLSQKSDIECIIRGIRLAIEAIKTSPFKDIGAELHWPRLPACAALLDASVSDDYLECLIRSSALTGHHAGGTCSMAGKQPVVDPSLRVLGVQGLSVVDASIFPTPVSSPPNSVITAIAEKAAQMILRRNNLEI